jgi:DNA polymerase-3 subunit delta
VKANRPQIEKALRAPAETRFFLFHGPDEAGSRALARRLGEALGKDAERVELTGADLKGDPARLADEAASLSLFGGARYILVERAGEESIPAIEALVDAPAAGNPVAVLAGALRPTAKLLKLALAEPRALAFGSYPPEGRDADHMILEMGRARGLIVRPDVATRIAEACGANRDLAGHELDKFALYLDATPDAPRPLEHDVVEALGTDSEGGDLSRLVEAVADGDADLLQAELLRLAGEGVAGIPLIRALLRRMTLLARLRAEVERGNSPSAVMAAQGKSLFFKEKDAVGPQLARWRSALLAKSIGRLLEAERQVKASGSVGTVAVDEELFAICRQAARLR